MPHFSLISQLAQNKLVFEQLLKPADEALILFRPHAKHWCLLEIICHLYDEEREDFRARISSILKDPLQPLAPFNPVAWLTERQYMEQEYEEKLSAFLAEREASLDWLTQLDAPNWAQAYQHPTAGPLSANSFLANWVAHDYLHIRQIVRIKYQYVQHLTGESIDYAGTW
ncbi:MAG: DinB family protein [Bacteroidota bacterium]